VLGLAILGLVKLFRHYRLAIDERLVLSTLPYILAGSSLRVIEDAEIVQPPWSYLLITPLIFFLVFLVTVGSLILTRRLLGEEFHRSYAAIGLAWTLFNLMLLGGVGLENGRTAGSSGRYSSWAPLWREACSSLAEPYLAYPFWMTGLTS